MTGVLTLRSLAGQPVPVRGHNGEVGTTDAGDTGSETGSDDTPPSHFVVSPSTSPTPGVARSLPPYTASGIDLTHKKGERAHFSLEYNKTCSLMDFNIEIDSVLLP